MAQRPSRRSANDSRWQVSQNLQLVMLAHYIADTNARKKELEHVMYTEASWALGRNPGNIVEMTGLGERHITDCYSTGRNDGEPETHPGQTPFNGTETWSPGHNGGDARVFQSTLFLGERRIHPTRDDARQDGPAGLSLCYQIVTTSMVISFFCCAPAV